MGKNEMSSAGTEVGESTIFAKTTAEASKMLEAALLQMDGIISGMAMALCAIFTFGWLSLQKNFSK